MLVFVDLTGMGVEVAGLRALTLTGSGSIEGAETFSFPGEENPWHRESPAGGGVRDVVPRGYRYVCLGGERIQLLG